jgi:cytochrome c
VLVGFGIAAPATAADAEHGKQVFKACAACDNITGEGGTLGPSLNGVVGRKAGSLDNFRYSPAMLRSGIVWDEAALKAYIADPQGKVKGNRMPFTGLAGAADIDDVTAYLATLK